MRADRLLSILLRLQVRRQITASELAQELEVSTRTIYRDIEALSMAGIPVYTQRGEYGGCFLEEGYQLSLTDLMLPEIQALLVQGGSAPLEDLDLKQSAQNGLLKLMANLPSYQQVEASAIQNRLYIDTRNWSQRTDVVPHLKQLQSAIWGNQIVEAFYQRTDYPPQQVRLEPYGLVVKTHIWYLVARAEDNPEFKVYRVSRFKDVQTLEKTFEREDSFDLKAKWHEMRETFEEVSAPDYGVSFRISDHLIQGLEFFIPNRYTIIEEKDNISLVEAQFYTVHEARSVLMGFGHFVDVIAPIELIDDILSVAHSLIRHYKDSFPSARA